MCTAITYKTDNCYFGRTLDVEGSYEEAVTVTPRNFEFNFRTAGVKKARYAIIGMATTVDGYPLYFDAANECGLAMAGLNFPKSARYFSKKETADNIAPFEFIPWVLCGCENLSEAKSLLHNLNLCEIDFSEKIRLTPLHWIIADKSGAITVESTADGLKIHENAVGVLTNEPPFDYHTTRLCDYMGLSKLTPQNSFGAPCIEPYSRGMGAIGLPGDLSSSSRFTRAAFVKLNSVSGKGEEESVSQFFHILGSVEQQQGCVLLPSGKYELTAYTSCINLDEGIYYYTTYNNSQINAVKMHACDLNSTSLITFPLANQMNVNWVN